MLCHPPCEGIDEWRQIYMRVARTNGGEPEAGRHLVSWLLAAQLPLSSIEYGATAVVYAPGDEPWRTNWGRAWADRLLHSSLHDQAIAYGVASHEELVRLADAWKAWAASPSSLSYYVNGEALVRVPCCHPHATRETE